MKGRRLPPTGNSQVEKVVEVLHPDGLHMRPAMQLVEAANSFGASIKICKDDECVDGKSIMQITMLAATKGTKLRIVAEGVDAEKAVETLAQLLENKTTESTA